MWKGNITEYVVTTCVCSNVILITLFETQK